MTRLTDKESTLPELKTDADTNDYLNWKGRVLGTVTLYPHFTIDMLTIPQSQLRLPIGSSTNDINTLYSLVWFRLWQSVHNLKR